MDKGTKWTIVIGRPRHSRNGEGVEDPREKVLLEASNLMTMILPYVHDSRRKISSRGDFRTRSGAAAERVHRWWLIDPAIRGREDGHRPRGADEPLPEGSLQAIVVVEIGAQAKRASLAAEQAGIAALVAARVDQSTFLPFVEWHLAGRTGRPTQHPRWLHQRSDLGQICNLFVQSEL